MHQPLSYLPFHAERAMVQTDADAHAAAYGLVTPLVDFLPRPGSPYRVEWVAARSGAVTILAGMSTPVLIELAQPTPQATLHLPCFGEGRYRVEGNEMVSRAGATALYLPGVPHRSETSSCAGLSIGLDPERLAATAARMAGDPEAVDRYRARFLQPLQLDQSDALVAHLCGLLRRMVALIDLEPSRGFELPASLPLERMIEQAAAALMVPGLAQG